MDHRSARTRWRLLQGNCLRVLRSLPAQSIDAVVTDPPYAEVHRPYGRLTEAAWMHLMQETVRQVRRVLKPRGSAVFVLQPNFRKLGSMRSWLWDFMAWGCREWNMVQDAWWWNYCTPPLAGSQRRIGLLRGSLKACVWLGPPDCYRDQDAVLWTPTDAALACKSGDRCTRTTSPSGVSINRSTFARTLMERGGVTPFNVIPISNANSTDGGGAWGHPASTPEPLCDWWVRYLSKAGDTVLDPFAGSCTVGLSCLKRGRHFIGIEAQRSYVAMGRKRYAAARKQLRLAKTARDSRAMRDSSKG